MNRRILLAALAIAAVTPALAASVVEIGTPRAPIFNIPRGIVVDMVLSRSMTTVHLMADGSEILSGPTITVQMISTGNKLVPIESDEGQEVLRSIAAPNAGRSRW